MKIVVVKKVVHNNSILTNRRMDDFSHYDFFT